MHVSFENLERELDLIKTEGNGHTTKQSSMVSSHNSLNEKVINFLAENKKYKKV